LTTRCSDPEGYFTGRHPKNPGHDRLGTTAIYLNLADAHIEDEYTQKW